MQSDARTVNEYLKSLPTDRARVISAVRKSVRRSLPKGYKECMRWGMISWEIPLSTYPNTYNGQPLNYVALAAQKNSYSLYLMGCYANTKDRLNFESEFKAAGKKLNAGKSCVRFKKIEDLPLEVIEKYIAKCEVEDFLKVYEKSRLN